jgi:hypothetical protein
MKKSMHFYLVVLSILWLQNNTFAQQENVDLKPIIEINKKTDFITTDKLGNVYAVNGDEISKYDQNGKFLQKNSIKSLGKITALDVTNPLKILVFYKDYNKIVFVDNMLAQSGNLIDLSALGYDQATLASTSHDNSFWIYNLLNFELVRLDFNMVVTNQSGNIAQLTGKGISPVSLIESNNMVYLCDSVEGIFMFDVFGTFIKNIPLKGIIQFQVENNLIYFINNKGFGSFNIEFLKENEVALPTKEALQVRLQKNRVFVRTADKIIYYSIGL